MKEKIFLAYFLISAFCLRVHCVFHMEIDAEKRNCTFVFSNGGYEEFLTAIPWFENCTKQFEENAIFFIQFNNYNLPAFPNGTFTGLPHLKSFTLKIFQQTEVSLLSPWFPSHSVFENLTFEKAVIDVKNSPNLNGWNWKALSKIRHQPSRSTDYFQFVAASSKLIRLDTSFGEIAGGQLTIVRIIKCQLRWLGPNVFAPLSKLMILELRKNFLEKFERSHLPVDASKLQILDLGINRLQYISEDLFRGLKLRRLYLDGNNLKLLNNQVDDIIAAGSLNAVSGFLGPCDCNRLKRLIRLQYFGGEKCYDNDSSNRTIEIFLDTCK